jgi:hypothetical protein
LEGPVAWEDPALPRLKRLLGTLGATFLPSETARSVAEGQVAPAARFAALSALPWAPLWAIIPFTHTLLFKPPFLLEELPEAGTSLTVDVLRAMLIGLVMSVFSLVSWSVPFASLLRAFSRDPRDRRATAAAYRTAFYRVWIIPFGMSLFWLSYWAFPATLQTTVGDFTFLCLQILPRMLVVLHCHAMARYFGAGGGASLLVAGVPLAVEFAAGRLLWHVAATFLPLMPGPVPGGAG